MYIIMMQRYVMYVMSACTQKYIKLKGIASQGL